MQSYEHHIKYSFNAYLCCEDIKYFSPKNKLRRTGSWVFSNGNSPALTPISVTKIRSKLIRTSYIHEDVDKDAKLVAIN